MEPATRLQRANPTVRDLEDGFVAGGSGHLAIVRLQSVNFVAGAERIPLRTNVAATGLGIIPSTFLYADLGRGLNESLEISEPSVPDLLLPLIGVAALAVTAILNRRAKVRRGLIAAVRSRRGREFATAPSSDGSAGCRCKKSPRPTCSWIGSQKIDPAVPGGGVFPACPLEGLVTTRQVGRTGGLPHAKPHRRRNRLLNA